MESTVTFFGDLGFDRAHKHVRDFENESKRQTWFANQPHDVFSCNYDKVNRSLKVEMEYTRAMGYSYCVVEIDTQQPLYCFIDDVTLINDRTVAFSLGIDVWQTYLFQFTLGRSFVTRAHVDRWTKSSTKPALQLYPVEGIDGFQVVKSEKQLVQSKNGYDYIWFVMARTVTSGTTSYIEYDFCPISTDKPKTPFAIPIAANGPTVAELLSGTAITNMGIDPNSILYMGVVPFMPININFTLTNGVFDIDSYSTNAGSILPIKIGSLGFMKWVGPDIDSLSGNPYNSLSVDVDVPTKPTSADATESQSNEPLMFIDPVRRVIAYTGQGVPLWFVPDDVLLQTTGNITLNVTCIPGASGFNSRVFIGSDFPRADALGRAFEIPGESIDAAGNNWLTYVATERDTSRMLLAANTARNVAKTVGGLLEGTDMLSLATTGARAAGAMINLAADTAYETAAMAINERGIRNSTNGALSSGSGTGTLFMYGGECRLVVTEADEVTKSIFFDKVRMMGYSVNKYMTPDIRSRYWFNYIATIGANVRGSFSESVRSEIAGIFNGGVTIWHDDAEMYTEKCNIERALL